MMLPLSCPQAVLQTSLGTTLSHRECTGSWWQKLGDLDSMLQDHVVAMLRLLNLFLDTSLGYTWKKALEVIAKMEGHGTNCVQTI